MSDENELTQEDMRALAKHSARQRAIAAERREEPADPHGFAAHWRGTISRIREVTQAPAAMRQGIQLEHASVYERMLSAWRESLPRCPDATACGGRCAVGVLEAWEAALEINAEVDARREANRQAEARRAAAPARLRALGASPRAVDNWEKGIGNPVALEAARECVKQLALPTAQRGKVLLALCGITGAGKTTAAVAAVGEYLSTPDGQPRKEGQPLPAYFLDAGDAASAGVYGAEAAAMLAEAKTADVLVLDDAGTEFSTERGPWVSVFDTIINARYAACLPTIITTNLSAEAFFKLYGERVRSRFHEAGRLKGCGAVDFRAQGVKS